jgi:hypothetical protein
LKMNNNGAKDYTSVGIRFEGLTTS